jgi:hypothetical protein
MSRSTNSDPRDAVGGETHDLPRVEPWIKISVAAFVPLVLAFYLPDRWRPALFAAGGLLVLAAMVALVRQERGKSADVSA